MFWKNKINYRFFVSLSFCLLLGLFCCGVAFAQDFNPITGLRQSVTGTGLDKTNDLPSFVGNVVKGILGFVGVLFLVLTIYAGVLWMLARGEEGKITKARGIIIAAITGLIIVMLSYAITTFIVGALDNGSSQPLSPTDTVCPPGGCP